MNNIVAKLTALAFGATLFASAGAAPIDVTKIATREDSTLNIVKPSAFFGQRTLTLQTWDVHTADGSVFLALCIEPGKALEKKFGASYVGDTFSGFDNNEQIKRLYSRYYTEALSSVTASHSFQLALWELNNDKGNVLLNGTATTGGLMNFTISENSGATYTNTLTTADAMLQYALSDAAIDHEYTFTQYTLDGYQTVVSASPLAAVPEPSTYAMLGLGLALVGFTARRRSKR